MGELVGTAVSFLTITRTFSFEILASQKLAPLYRSSNSLPAGSQVGWKLSHSDIDETPRTKEAKSIVVIFLSKEFRQSLLLSSLFQIVEAQSKSGNKQFRPRSLESPTPSSCPLSTKSGRWMVAAGVLKTSYCMSGIRYVVHGM